MLSASRALSSAAQASGEITVSNLRDLCTLIDLAVLYDELQTIGNAQELDDTSKPHIATEYARIRQATGLAITIGPLATDLSAVIRESSSFAVLPIARAGRDATLSDLQGQLRSSLRQETSGSPDYWEDFEEGKRLAIGAATDPSMRRSAALDFWYRTFIYAGFSQAKGIPFVPDTVRLWGMVESGKMQTAAADKTADSQEPANALGKVVREKFSENVGRLTPDAPIPIPPFAATVFKRAGATHAMLVPELIALREEMAGVRRVLRDLEQDRAYGEYSTRLQTVFPMSPSPRSIAKVDARVHDALEILRQASVPLPPSLLEFKPLFKVIMGATSLVRFLIAPKWKKAYGAAKTFFEIARSISELNPPEETHAVAELHNLIGWDLRRFLNERIKMKDLFGPLRDDTPLAPAAHDRLSPG